MSACRSTENNEFQDKLRVLLLRYPDLSPPELNELIGLYKHGPLLDIGLVSSDPTLGPRMRQLRDEQRGLLRPSLLETVAVVGVTIGPLLALIWVSL